MTPVVLAHHQVVELRPELDPSIGRPASALVELAVPGIDQQRVLRGVELDVRGAQTDELHDLVAKDLRDVAEERLRRTVRADRAVRIPEVGEQAGAGERDLHDAVGSTSCVRELLRGEEPLAAERVDHGDRRTLDLHVTELVAPPSTPQERVDVPFREAVDGLGELALEREAAHLAVGEDREAGCFLQTDGVVDRRVLDALERRVRELVPREPLARVDEVGWTEEAPDDIGSR